MSERWRKFQLLVVRFIVWLTQSWLWRKFTLLALRFVVWLDPSLVDRKIRETARAGALKYGRSELEDELAEWQKNCLDKMLHPQADPQGSPKSGHIGSAENTMPLQLQLRENCLKDCLDELSKSWGVAFQQKGAKLETEFEPSIPAFRFDYQKVQQAAANLLNSALYQALPGGTVTLRCLSRPNGAEVSLTGAAEHDQKVFDNCPTPRSRPRNYQESLAGGLTIAKSLILAHRGRIWVEPSSSGSKFVFSLPMDAS